MRSRKLVGAIAGMTLMYSTAFGEIKPHSEPTAGRQAYAVGKEACTQYERSVAMLDAQGIAAVEIGKVYTTAVCFDVYLMGRSALRHVLQSVGINVPILNMEKKGFEEWIHSLDDVLQR